MEVVYWLMLGLLAGFLAKSSFPAQRDQAIGGLLIAGCVGAVVGGFALHQLGRTGPLGAPVWGYAAAFVGAVLILAVQRAVTSLAPQQSSARRR